MEEILTADQDMAPRSTIEKCQCWDTPRVRLCRHVEEILLQIRTWPLELDFLFKLPCMHAHLCAPPVADQACRNICRLPLHAVVAMVWRKGGVGDRGGHVKENEVKGPFIDSV